jgi:hypothetical protein
VSRIVQGWTAHNDSAISYEFVATQPLRGRTSVTAGLGYYDLPKVLRANYLFWNVGVTVGLGHAQLAVMYVDTDSAAVQAFGSEIAANSWSGSISWRF